MMTKKSFSWTAVLGVGFGLMLAMGNTGCGGAAPTPPAAPDTASAAGAGGDADGDGVPDGADKCPDKKEDGAAPDPKDGCPKA